MAAMLRLENTVIRCAKSAAVSSARICPVADAVLDLAVSVLVCLAVLLLQS